MSAATQARSPSALPVRKVAAGGAAGAVTIIVVWILHAAFKIDMFEVSNRNYRLCVRAAACTEPQDISSYQRDDRLDDPVVSVF